MTVLLIVLILGMILFGYLVMCRLDNFLENGGILDSPKGRANQGVLVYGAPDIADKIHKLGTKCRTLMEPVFPDDGLYSALFALSADDRENLVICRAAKQTDSNIYIIARNNDPRLHEVFEAAGADHILYTGEPIDRLLTELWGIDI